MDKRFWDEGRIAHAVALVARVCGVPEDKVSAI